jgi:hypothetical protein
LLLIALVAFANNHDAFISNIEKKVELEKAVFSYDDIRLHGSMKSQLKLLKNCKKIDSDNWNYSCAGEKTYLFASKHDSIMRFRVIEKMSLDDMTKKVEKLSSIYGPANITIRNTTRPFDRHHHGNDRISESLWDSHWDAYEPVSFTWYEHDHPDCCVDEVEGKELKVKYWFGSMMLTVSDEKVSFFEEQKPLDFEKLILSDKTSIMLGLAFVWKGLVFLLLVLFYKYFLKEANNKGSAIQLTAVSTIVAFIFLSWIGVLVELNSLSLLIVFPLAALVAWFMIYKKI